MKCAIMQPTYIPWCGYFDLIDQVDRFVFLDTVQVVKGSWSVRNRIKTQQGELCLTISLKRTKSKYETMFYEALINYEQQWIDKHLKSIQIAYSKALYFNEVYSFLEKLIESKKNTLSEFNINIIKNIAFKIGINKEFIKASELRNINGKKDALVVSICKAIGCDYYLSPAGAYVYIEKNSPGGEFPKNGINLYYQNYVHPIYNQLYGDFMPYMSVIDLIFNCGFKKSLEVIKRGRKEPIDYLSFCKDVFLGTPEESL